MIAGASALVVLAVMGLFLVGLVNSGDPPGLLAGSVIEESQRQAVPDLRLAVLSAGDGLGPAGTEVSLRELGGRTVVLNVWASWCGPCEDEAPVLERVARDYRAQGDEVLVLGLDVQDLRGDALDFIAENGLSYPSLRDAGEGTDRALRTAGVPETFIVDSAGRVAMRHIGPVIQPAQLTQPIARIRAGAGEPAESETQTR